MRIACFGITANPPHLGHQENARIILRSGYVDRVWIIPVFDHPLDKFDLVSFEHRLNMSKFFEERNIYVCAVESEIGGTSYTSRTIRHLRKKHPNDIFYWCVGSDVVATREFLNWRDWPKLEKETKFLVVERPQFPFYGWVGRSYRPLEAQLAPPCFVCVGKNNYDFSSTEVRRMIREGKDIAPYVGKEIAEYIRVHKLYQKEVENG